MMIYIYDSITILRKKKIMIREGEEEEEENSKEWLTKDIKAILYFNGSFHFIVVISIQQINRDIYPTHFGNLFLNLRFK